MVNNMQDFSLLNKKCLANMPMLLETIAVSMNSLREVLSSIYDDIEIFVKKECKTINYKISDDYERGTMYVMGSEEDYESKYLESFKPFTEIHYMLEFVQQKRKNIIRFEVEIGYSCDEEQHVIYFQLNDESNQVGITENILNKVIEQGANSFWRIGGDDCSVYMEFAVDETLSIDKIKECAEDFKCEILKPTFSLLL